MSPPQLWWLGQHIDKKLEERRGDSQTWIEAAVNVRFSLLHPLSPSLFPSFLLRWLTYLVVVIIFDLQEACPPLNFSNFRIVVVRDALPGTKSAHAHVQRSAQITMWNVLALGEDFLVEGGRYRVRCFLCFFFLSLSLRRESC